MKTYKRLTSGERVKQVQLHFLLLVQRAEEYAVERVANGVNDSRQI